MNTQTPSEQHIDPRTPSALEPLDPVDRELQPIRYWQQKYERYLLLTGRKATQERYSRALERFFGKHPGATYLHQLLRPQITQYVESRLSEGASVSTVRLEMSAIRGLFQFALDMGAADVMFNPAKNVKVPKTKNSPARAVPEG